MKIVRRFPLVALLSYVALLSCSGERSGEEPGSYAGSGASSGATSTGGAAGTGGSSGAASGGAPGAGGSAGSNASSGNGGGGASAGAGGASAGAGGASAGAAGASGGNSGSSGAAGGPTLPPITDYTQDGPFETTVDEEVGPGELYTVFRPKTLGEGGFLHAPIIFGPGINQNVSVHTSMLTIFASHGFVVVGTPVLSGGPGAAGNLQSMQNGLDWIVEQNTTPGIYQGKLWPDHAISMGFSVGGTAAVQLGGDPAVATVVSIHGHSATAALHGTMLQTTGTADTIGMPLQQETYDASEVQTFLATLTGANHPYIESNAGGNERPAIVAWMRYWIYGDAGAEHYFFGEDCVLCAAPWQDPQRKNWQ